ncbi:type II secretion system minor pseudopilin GspI [Arenimonas aestuarii]
MPFRPRSERRHRPAGFTLLEVLVALAIISIALLAALRAAGIATTSLQELRGRQLAVWVADNRLAEHRARGAWLPLGIAQGQEEQGGIGFAWREEVASTPNPAFRRVDIFVHASQSPEHRLAHVTGFVVNAPGPSP